MRAGRSISKSNLPPEIYVTDPLPIFINVTKYPARSTRKNLMTSGFEFLFGYFQVSYTRVCRAERAS